MFRASTIGAFTVPKQAGHAKPDWGATAARVRVGGGYIPLGT